MRSVHLRPDIRRWNGCLGCPNVARGVQEVQQQLLALRLLVRQCRKRPSERSLVGCSVPRLAYNAWSAPARRRFEPIRVRALHARPGDARVAGEGSWALVDGRTSAGPVSGGTVFCDSCGSKWIRNEHHPD